MGLDLAWSDSTAEVFPDLAKVLKHLNGSRSPARWLEEEGLEASEWVKFDNPAQLSCSF